MKVVKEENDVAPNPQKKVPVAQYDPRKQYTWSPDDAFTFNGAEYGVILNALRAIVHTPESHRILVAERALNVLETALAQGVEQGIVKEKVETNEKR